MISPEDLQQLEAIALDPEQTQIWMQGFGYELSNPHTPAKVRDRISLLRDTLAELSTKGQATDACTVWGNGGERP